MKRIPSIVMMISVCGLLACSRKESSGALEGRSVSEIRIRYVGENILEEDRIRSLLAMKVGDRFSAVAVDSDTESLYASGLIDDVRFSAEADGFSVRVMVEVSPRRSFGPLVFVGNMVFPDKQLADVCFSGDPPVTMDSLERARRRLKEFYIHHGYLDVEVECGGFEGGDADPEDFVFVIVEGIQ